MEKLIKSAQEAKELSIEIWSAIVELKLNNKEDLTLDLWAKIKDLRANCPLCEYFKFDTGHTYHDVNDHIIKPIIGVDCDKCPLAKAGHECNNDEDINYKNYNKHGHYAYEKCFDKHDYYTQWSEAFDVYSNKEKAIEVCNNAAIGILGIIKDWEI